MDLNLDGRQDLVEQCGIQLGRLIGDGAGGLSAVTVFSGPVSNVNGVNHFVPAEVTGGGAPEIVFAGNPVKAHAKLRVAETILARGAKGKRATKKRTITLKRPKAKKRRRR